MAGIEPRFDLVLQARAAQQSAKPVDQSERHGEFFGWCFDFWGLLPACLLCVVWAEWRFTCNVGI